MSTPDIVHYPYIDSMYNLEEYIISGIIDIGGRRTIRIQRFMGLLDAKSRRDGANK